jgi:hypothetical protein
MPYALTPVGGSVAMIGQSLQDHPESRTRARRRHGRMMSGREPPLYLLGVFCGYLLGEPVDAASVLVSERRR